MEQNENFIAEKKKIADEFQLSFREFFNSFHKVKKMLKI
jgi:hypothetical protein